MGRRVKWTSSSKPRLSPGLLIVVGRYGLNKETKPAAESNAVDSPAGSFAFQKETVLLMLS